MVDPTGPRAVPPELIPPCPPPALALLALALAGTSATGEHLRWIAAGRSAGAEAEQPDPVADALASANADLLRRIAAKELLAADLVAGRATLAHVTAEFLRMNAPDDVCMAVVRGRYPGRTDFERTAGNVLEYAGNQLAAMPPADRDRAAARLARELADAVDDQGDPADPAVRAALAHGPGDTD